MNREKINEQITVLKHTWKVKPNATPMVQMKKNTNRIIIII